MRLRPPRSTLFPYMTLFRSRRRAGRVARLRRGRAVYIAGVGHRQPQPDRSEEHTSELQSQSNLVCRLLLEKKDLPVPTLKMPVTDGVGISHRITRTVSST